MRGCWRGRPPRLLFGPPPGAGAAGAEAAAGAAARAAGAAARATGAAETEAAEARAAGARAAGARAAGAAETGAAEAAEPAGAEAAAVNRLAIAIDIKYIQLTELSSKELHLTSSGCEFCRRICLTHTSSTVVGSRHFTGLET